MENENKEVIIDSNETDETVEEVVETVEAEETEAESTQEEHKEEKVQESPEAKYARLTRQKEQLEKKFGFKPKPKPIVQVETKQNNPSLKDYVALKNADIHEDDVDDVIEFATFKKISLAEALKSSVVKATLKEKEELRTTAQATNTGKTRGGSSKVSGENLLEKASKTGEIPDNDEAMNAMLDARYKR
jgi:hypothetical protein